MNSRCPFSEVSVKPRESTVIFIFRFNAYHLGGGGGRGGGTRYNGLYGEIPLGRDTFFRLQVYERAGMLLLS